MSDAERLPPDSETDDQDLARLGAALAEAAHDLRNPLAAISNLAEVLRRDPSQGAERLDRLAELLHAHTAQARGIVEDLLLVAAGQKARSENLVLHERVVALLHRRAREETKASVRILLDDDPNSLGALIAPVALDRILTNLIGNAEAILGENDGGTIRIAINEEPSDRNQVRLLVEDDGPGIPEDLRSEIFRPFHTARRGGTGLGLAVCRRLVDEAEGRIEVEPREGGGSRFIVTLPRATISVDAESAEDRASSSPESPSPPGLRLLLVDDDRNALETFERLLSLDGHDVVTAHEGRRGLERFLAEDFDVAIVDIRIPDLSGTRFYERVRAEDPARARRLVFATGDCHNPETRAFLDATGNPYLVKPFAVDELRRALEFVNDRSP